MTGSGGQDSLIIRLWELLMNSERCIKHVYRQESRSFKQSLFRTYLMIIVMFNVVFEGGLVIKTLKVHI